MSKDFSKLYLEKQLCFPLYAASRLTTQIYEPFLSELDITYPQYLVLMVLWEQNDLAVNEIGARLLLESNTLTPLLKRLEQKLLISRNRSADDERRVHISLTKKGEQLKNKALSIPDKLLGSLSAGALSMHEMKDFQKTLKKLVKVLAEGKKNSYA